MTIRDQDRMPGLRPAALPGRALLLALVLVAGSPVGAVAQQEVKGEEAGRSAAQDSTFPEPPFSPGGAFWRSLIIPGWAQSELGAKTRGAFYFFAESFSLFMIARTEIRLKHALRTRPEDDGLVVARRQQKQDWIALAVFWAVFAAADGWVSVQLYGFDERTTLTPEGVAFQVGWEIPLGP